MRADYVAGCDGGASTVRKQLGIGLHGRGSIGTLRQVFFRSDDLVDKVSRVVMARHFFVADRPSADLSEMGGWRSLRAGLRWVTMRADGPVSVSRAS
ncbi:MAG: FAD-dependent monooxygenase [Mycobacteriales bacterium]